MKTSYKWIQDLVPGLKDIDIKTFADAMTMSGTKVEYYNQMDANLSGIVIGQIKEIKKHPDADKLVVCQVDLGKEMTQIVTGASNVYEGAKVPVVVPGGKVAATHSGGKQDGGTVIKAGKLRGVDSFGMMCSIDELGSDTNMFPDADPDGIYILKEDAVVGEDAVSYLGLDDTIIEYEITSNRVDCNSVIGIAREAAATFKMEFNPHRIPETGNDEDVNDYIKVTVTDKNYCRRFTGRVVKNIKIAPSPDWMKERLVSQGIRPINNIVDITNYVMEEYGQPMHAYDLDTIEGHEIIVRNAKPGEKFVTLDGQERTLDEDMCMINDAKRAIGIGGIMGGENTMITDDVTTMFFEAACFNGPNIRKSAKRLGLRTEASSMFEKGLDPENASLAINRACALVEELGAGEVVGGMIDIYPDKPEEIILDFEPDKYNSILGTNISRKDQIEYLKRVSLGPDDNDKIHVPSFRQDVLSYADVAEEVARFYGYDNIPVTLPEGGTTPGARSQAMNVTIDAANTLRSYGYSECYCYSFESPRVFSKLLFAEDAPERKAIEILNPLGEDFSIMRTTSVAGLLTAIATNSSRRNGPVKLYERGHIYIPKELPLTELPDEQPVLTFGFNSKEDFYDLKGAFEEILLSLGLSKRPRFEPGEDYSFLHPTRQAKVRYGKGYVGFLGQVHPLVCENFGIKEDAYIAVMDLRALSQLANNDVKYKQIANFPKATRDIALLVPSKIRAANIEDVITKKGGKYLESFALFDIYEGEQVKEGFKSMAYTLTFRAMDKSLSDSDVNEAVENILETLKKSDVTLRT